MSKSTSVAYKGKATRTKNGPRGSSDLGRSFQDLVPMAIRAEKRQRDELDLIAKGLMMHKADLIRKGLDLGIEWGRERMAKLGR